MIGDEGPGLQVDVAADQGVADEIEMGPPAAGHDEAGLDLAARPVSTEQLKSIADFSFPVLPPIDSAFRRANL